MFDKAHFGRVVNFSINIFLGIALVLVGLTLADNLQPMIFWQSFVVSVGIGYTVCDLIPSPAWGEQLARKAGIKSKLLFHLLSTAIAGVVLIVCISLGCQFVAFGGAVFQVWPYALPYLLIAGYITLVVFLPVCKEIAGVLTR
ncbi:hypothetical protein JMY81_08515 [Brenneria goodwinii]|uniref:hypothetical protein n=1 Tax=Brenneria goodwinii TaxID=1109412 RepID=UPI000EF1E07E|nr:hypothetical protein [Brenneria goodwinii]MCG8156384.1 hypothetical protein [Brenneria goodwinii]MCG8160877.1 hypothetical protein [Brenneria goodwinii]MCG8166190.1 hypothetical protein [Brenneria goodwinii]MCG8169714.1 hypothetical protein [Brenneria goodwinii]MCG8175043.1 hypothetical protein [Brenneria goodwinii]